MTVIRHVTVSDDPQVAALVDILRAHCHLDATGLVVDDPHAIATAIVESQRETRRTREANGKWINGEGKQILRRCYPGLIPAVVIADALRDKARHDRKIHLLEETT
ncbi:hypothetical protein GCM10009837_06940 [Streptomyces durmitorensis]|uniref:Uncharacterized protein n=1 Tax=Streptomyces durmitorensis TaxID=319947 RepID=A0ABY4PM08_9ACTN|nr:hypothetical protein [Streptomyces durmitorensis]UQT54410.1 hypothetical protein M4V62_04510 [Streptomyces durmitorensis]